MGSLDPLFWRFCIFSLEDMMEEITIFIFGSIATILAIGPLAVAFYLDLSSKDEE